MFTTEERARLRSDLLQRAETDRRITGGAITGSAAADKEDVWSDIDLAFGVGDAGQIASVLTDWTRHMVEERGAVHHVDVRAGEWIYRVFLLANTLQVDLAFAPATEFRPLAPTFRLVFGNAEEARGVPQPGAAELIGYAWLYALHARSCLARRRWWQAEYMIGGVRDHALALACLRHGLPTVHGRGFDDLPPEATAKFAGSLVGQLDAGTLAPAFRVAVAGLVYEIERADEALAGKLKATLISLADLHVGTTAP